MVESRIKLTMNITNKFSVFYIYYILEFSYLQFSLDFFISNNKIIIYFEKFNLYIKYKNLIESIF